MFNYKFGHHPDQIRLFEESEKNLDPEIFVVSGVYTEKNIKTHNENNHV